MADAAQSGEHRRLVLTGDQPEQRPVEGRKGQRHPAPSLVQPRERDVGVRDIEHRITRNQRRGVSVGTQAEMDEIENRRRAGDFEEGLRIAPGCLVEVGRFHGHRVDLHRTGSSLREQARAQVRQVPVRVTVGGDPFVHLQHVDVLPRDVQ
jgi:hypothetical protein